MTDQENRDKMAREGARILAGFCGQTRKEDRALVVADESTRSVGEYLLEALGEFTTMREMAIAPLTDMHGIEPPAGIAKKMAESDIIFGVTKHSMAHTLARMNATKNGARYLSLPDYDLELLTSSSLRVDFVKWARIGKHISELLEKTEKIKVKTRLGTELIIQTGSRGANFCPGFCPRPGMLGSPPDIETNVPPLEDGSDGTLVVDGSIPCKEIGLVAKPIRIDIANGTIVKIDESAEQGKTLRNVFDRQKNPKALVLAEFGIGLNPGAKLTGRMLEDEGCLGTVHFGFGSNSTIGGKNHVSGFHLDLIITKATVLLDETEIMSEGKLDDKIERI